MTPLEREVLQLVANNPKGLITLSKGPIYEILSHLQVDGKVRCSAEPEWPLLRTLWQITNEGLKEITSTLE